MKNGTIVELEGGAVVVWPTAWPRCYVLPSADSLRFQDWIVWAVGRRVLLMLAVGVPGVIAAIWMSVTSNVLMLLAVGGISLGWLIWQGAMLSSFEGSFPSARRLNPATSRFAVAASFEMGYVTFTGMLLALGGGAAIYFGISNPGMIVLAFIAITVGAPLVLLFGSWIEARDWPRTDKLQARLSRHVGSASGAPA